MKNNFLGALLLIQACLATFGQSETVETKDYTTSGCRNFTFSSLRNSYLPSDVISINGSCDTTQDTKALCPSWNITSPIVQIKILRNYTVHDGTKCTRIMEIQGVEFDNVFLRNRLLVEFEHPQSEPVKEINVERSDDGRFCRQSRDCYYFDQFCSTSDECTCSDQWVFTRNARKCVPGIFRVKGQCEYKEQCLIPYSNCHYTTCECDNFYRSNLNYTRCIPEGRRYLDSCLTDENCQLTTKESVCKNGYCKCRDGYTYPDGKGKMECLPNGGASFQVGFGWWIAVFIVILKVIHWN